MAGGIVHVEFRATDSPALADFYSGIFGWQTHANTGMEGYIVWQAGDQMPGGGFSPAGEHTPNTLVYIHVDDIDAALAEINAKGGSTIAPKFSIGEHGFCAIFKDPQGNTVGLWNKT